MEWSEPGLSRTAGAVCLGTQGLSHTGPEILLQAGSPRALQGCPGRQGACHRVALSTAGSYGGSREVPVISCIRARLES